VIYVIYVNSRITQKSKKEGHKLMKKIVAYLLVVSMMFCITTSNQDLYYLKNSMSP